MANNVADDVAHTQSDFLQTITDAQGGSAHVTGDIGQMFSDIGKLVADEVQNGNIGDSKTIMADLGAAGKDFLQTISDASNHSDHTGDSFAKTLGDLNKLVTDLEHHDANQPAQAGQQPDNVQPGHQPGQQPGMAPVDQQHHVDQHQDLGNTHGFDAHVTHDVPVMHHG